ALAKFATFTPKIGYPDKWRDYSGLEITRGHYYHNVRAARAFEYRRQLAKAGKPAAKDERGMPPQTVNAYYNPQRNEIAFPAAILQPPFFDPDMDDAVNYGAIGGVIGHELLHGFDDQGSKFDANGNYRMWWTPQDRERFEARTQKLVQQANNFVALRNFQNGSTVDMTVDGALTLGENIADLGGLTIAYQALQRALGGTQPEPIDGLTADQRFFLAWAQVWRRNYREEELKPRPAPAVHAPAPFPVNRPPAPPHRRARAVALPRHRPAVEPGSLPGRLQLQGRRPDGGAGGRTRPDLVTPHSSGRMAARHAAGTSPGRHQRRAKSTYISRPATSPPRWAKWAMPGTRPVRPSTVLARANSVTSSQAGIGTGGSSSITRWRGNSTAKAVNRPNRPPEAPRVTLTSLPSGTPIHQNCSSPPPITHTRKNTR